MLERPCTLTNSPTSNQPCTKVTGRRFFSCFEATFDATWMRHPSLFHFDPRGSRLGDYIHLDSTAPVHSDQKLLFLSSFLLSLSHVFYYLLPSDRIWFARLQTSYFILIRRLVLFCLIRGAIFSCLSSLCIIHTAHPLIVCLADRVQTSVLYHTPLIPSSISSANERRGSVPLVLLNRRRNYKCSFRHRNEINPLLSPLHEPVVISSSA